MMNPLRRRFVNLVAENCTSGVCSLHRLDVSKRLFYPSTAEAEAAKPTIYRLSLPPPACSFQPAVAGTNVNEHIFGLANPGISDSRILWSSQLEGNTMLYDADSHTARSLPSGLRYMGKRPTVISAPVPIVDDDDSAAPAGDQQEDLFVMSSGSGYYPSFQVLRFDHSKPKRFNDDALLFDTVRRDQWATTDLQMPFSGAPQYVPDLNLWLGVHWSGDDEDDRHHLCASSDLGVVVDAAMRGRGADDTPSSVIVTRHWKEGLETPVGWEMAEAQLIDLGGSRFCVTKIIDEVVIEYNTVDKVYGAGNGAALLTSVEMVCGRGVGDG